MQIHGTADATVPYTGNLAFAHIDTVVKFWANLNACFPLAEEEEVANTNQADGCTATHYVWQPQGTAASVEFYKINGGGHSWPGAIININITNMDFNASSEIWRFFSAYKLSDLQEPAYVQEPNRKQFLLYPNPGRGIFTIDLGIHPEQETRIQVVDLTGREILNIVQKEKATTYSLEQLSSGIYIYIISGNDEIMATGKLLIENQ
jgi:polyhydroxybutyrate depolymerase